MSALTFSHCGGDIYYRTAPITHEDAGWLLKLFHTEWQAAVRAQDERASTNAATLHGELYLAWAKAKDWARASGVAR